MIWRLISATIFLVGLFTIGIFVMGGDNTERLEKSCAQYTMTYEHRDYGDFCITEDGVAREIVYECPNKFDDSLCHIYFLDPGSEK